MQVSLYVSSILHCFSDLMNFCVGYELGKQEWFKSFWRDDYDYLFTFLKSFFSHINFQLSSLLFFRVIYLPVIFPSFFWPFLFYFVLSLSSYLLSIVSFRQLHSSLSALLFFLSNEFQIQFSMIFSATISSKRATYIVYLYSLHYLLCICSYNKNCKPQIEEYLVYIKACMTIAPRNQPQSCLLLSNLL